MKTLFLTLAFCLTAAGAKAQYSYGEIESFYEANPELIGGANYAGRSVNPSYLLVDWNRRDELDQRMISNGFVRLGVSHWTAANWEYGGIPQKDLAIAYARTIGADVVIYSIQWSGGTDPNHTDHTVSFYAKQVTEVRRAAPSDAVIPNNATASAAMNRLQDALGKPHVKGGVWYDAASDTYNWIGPKFGRRMSESRAQFLSDVGRYL
ncbi:MAG: hypothetical protein JO333_10265 [Verrucomicrobia bacterium]|nr:hypothetical protein [Verrucomicrobiota bacterium]